MMRKYDILSDKPLVTTANRRYLFFLIPFGLFVLFFALGGRSLENMDSVRFAEISREILEYGDWILLRLGGAIYPDKPALHFWITAWLYKVFGISPLIARLPEAVAGFCGIMITFFFAAKIFRSSETAFLAAIILLSTYGYFFWARRTRIDIELAVFYSLSLVLFYFGTDTQKRLRKTLWYSGFWISTGFAFMCKGPVAFSNLATVISYGIFILRNPEGRKIAPGLLAITSPIAALPVLPWAVPLLNHPEFSGFMEAYDQTVIMHRGFSFFTYFYDFPMRLFPASPFFFLGVWGFFRFRKQLVEARGLIFILLWVGVYVFILHLSSGKNARYLLPIHLPASMVAAWAITWYINKYPETFGKIMRWGDRIFLVGAVLCVFLPLAFAYYFKLSFFTPIPYVILLGMALFIARKFLPLKSAGLFLSFILIILSIEVAAAIVDEKTATFRQITHTLKKEGLAPEEIAFYRCDTGGRANLAISYYYNKVITCSNDFKKIAEDPDIRGIVTTEKAIKPLTSGKQFESHFQVIPKGHEYFIILKPH
jgi:4-amino-4-deoxy-L-arabinose transferase-like glycosyltransferase